MPGKRALLFLRPNSLKMVKIKALVLLLQMQERLDELLGKIHEQGMDSLSEQERKFLETTSEKLRKTS